MASFCAVILCHPSTGTSGAQALGFVTLGSRVSPEIARFKGYG